jgi:hypothetical protein
MEVKFQQAVRIQAIPAHLYSKLKQEDKYGYVPISVIELLSKCETLDALMGCLLYLTAGGLNKVDIKEWNVSNKFGTVTTSLCLTVAQTRQVRFALHKSDWDCHKDVFSNERIGYSVVIKGNTLSLERLYKYY